MLTNNTPSKASSEQLSLPISKNIDMIRSHIEKQFDDNAIEMFPFPHLIVENFFPEDVYRDILKFNLFNENRGVDWITKEQSKNMKTTTPYDHRKQIYLPSRDGFIATEEAKAFWKDIESVFLQDNWFVNLVYNRFPAYFDIRFGEFFREDNYDKFGQTLFLQKHDPDYYIGPHTDVAVRIFTCIFSFAYEQGFEDFGTLLLRHKNELNRCWGDDHYRFDEFEVAKVAPYKPNNFLLFFKTRQSFHGVKTISREVPAGRYGMHYQFVEPKGGLFHDMSRPDLCVINHHKKH